MTGSDVDARLATAVARARASDELWIHFATGWRVGPSLEQMLRDDGKADVAQAFRQAKRLARGGLGALYRRGAFRFCEHPLELGSGNGEYRNGGGDLRTLREGRLYRAGIEPGQLTAWEEPTPVDAVRVLDVTAVTQAVEAEHEPFGPGTRFTGTAYDDGMPPAVWRTERPLSVVALVDRDGMLREVTIETDDGERRRGTRLMLEYRSHPHPV